MHETPTALGATATTSAPPREQGRRSHATCPVVVGSSRQVPPTPMGHRRPGTAPRSDSANSHPDLGGSESKMSLYWTGVTIAW